MDADTKTFLEEQLARMPTKDDLVALETRLSHDIAEVAESVGALASHIDERLDEIQPVLDRVENHEKRLRFVEDRVTELAKK